jgi:hypothetical protein
MAGAAPPPPAGYVATDLGITEGAQTIPFLISPNGRYVVAEVSPTTTTLPTTELIDTTTMASTSLPPRPGNGNAAAPNAIEPLAVNDSGVVAGWTYESFSGIADTVQAAVLWTPAGGVVDVGAAVGAQGTPTEFSVINDGERGCNGVCGTGAAGWLTSLDGGPFEATGCAATAGAFFDVPVCFNFSGPEHTDAINASGTMITNNLSPVPGPVAASYPQVIEWSGANLPAIPPGLTGYQTLASNAAPGSIRWLNDNGDLIVEHNGQTSTVDGVGLYTAVTQAVQLIQGPGASGAQVTPAALNNDDAVVGAYSTSGKLTSTTATGFVWTPTAGMSNLADQVVSITNEPAKPAQVFAGVGIGNNGDIIAYGTAQQGCPTAVPNCVDAYLLQPPTLSVDSVTPSVVPLMGSAPDALHVTGNGFGPAGTADTVMFCVTGGGACLDGTGVNVTDDTDLYVIAPNVTSLFPNGFTALRWAGAATANKLDVVVNKPSGLTSARTPADQVTVTKLAVTELSTHLGPTNGKGVVLTITGTGFTGATAVTLVVQKNGMKVAAASFAVVNDTTITATLPDLTNTPAGPLWAPPGATYVPTFGSLPKVTTDVEVSVGNATSPANPPNDAYSISPVLVTGVSASSPGPTLLVGGFPLKITGWGFTGADEVVFEFLQAGPLATPWPSLDLSGPEVVSDNEIDIVVPNVSAVHTTASPSNLTVDVGVDTPSVSSPPNAPADQFTFVGPSVTNLAVTDNLEPPFKNGVPLGGGGQLTITGSGFTGATDLWYTDLHSGNGTPVIGGGNQPLPAAAVTDGQIAVYMDDAVASTAPSASVIGPQDPLLVQVQVSVGNVLSVPVDADIVDAVPPQVTSVTVQGGGSTLPSRGGPTVTITGTALLGAADWHITWADGRNVSFDAPPNLSDTTYTTPAPDLRNIILKGVNSISGAVTVQEGDYIAPATNNVLTFTGGGTALSLLNNVHISSSGVLTGTAVATSTDAAGGTVTASASGAGTLTVGQYASDPVAGLSSSTGGFFDVSVSSGNSFTSVTVTDANLNGGTSLQYWDPQAADGAGAWEPVSPAPPPPSGDPLAITFTITGTSSPDIAQLTGTVFGAVGSPPPSPSPFPSPGQCIGPPIACNPQPAIAPSTGPCGASTDAAFICNAYVDLLGRQPDAAGLTTFTSLLAQGWSRGQVAGVLLASTERRQDLVAGWYQADLGRAPDPGGLAHFAALLASGAADEAVQAQVLGSPEFIGRNGGASGFVPALYRTVLGRAPDADGLSYWNGLLARGMTPQLVVSAMLDSAEYRGDLVGGWYERLLGRAPDATGRAHFVSEINAGTTDEAVISQIVGSDEYLARARAMASNTS